LEGGLLPIISLTSLHFFIKYDDNKSNKIEYTTNEDVTITPEKIEYPLSGTDATYIIVEEDVEEDGVENVVQDSVQNDILSEPILTNSLEEIKEYSIEEEVTESTIGEEEQFNYETSQLFDMQDQLTPVTTTTTDDGIRRLTYTKPS
jgi:long-subunit acyl-CoA synthetase (AMP-forming)